MYNYIARTHTVNCAIKRIVGSAKLLLSYGDIYQGAKIKIKIIAVRSGNKTIGN